MFAEVIVDISASAVDKIFDYILNTEEDNVSLIARTAWENIKQELLEKEKMIVLKEILGWKWMASNWLTLQKMIIKR